MAALEKALPRLRANDPSLACLDLEENNIGDGGAAHVADALRVNTSLKKLYLEGNNIGPEGAAQLADALRGNTSLKRLDLIENNIGPEGAAHLADASCGCAAGQHLAEEAVSRRE
eukprot:TRINITY_DN2893_c0_g1_i4.p2 TRINITY_DN2893_c0_g1~~TRINITY_DN2893_c0_g1_i4.p2  ORF type:complete len:131 (-),score=26.59 TRINITY_DN2893_c0_g1_i4:74-418(-)